MEKRNGDIILHDTHIGIFEETVDERDFHSVYGTVINHLRGAGFQGLPMS